MFIRFCFFSSRHFSTTLCAGPFVRFGRFTVACCSPHTHIQFQYIKSSQIEYNYIFAFLRHSQMQSLCAVCFVWKIKKTRFYFVYSLSDVYGWFGVWSTTMNLIIVHVHVCVWFGVELTVLHPSKFKLKLTAIKMTCEHKHILTTKPTAIAFKSHSLCARSVFMSRLLYFFFVNNICMFFFRVFTPNVIWLEPNISNKNIREIEENKSEKNVICFSVLFVAMILSIIIFIISVWIKKTLKHDNDLATFYRLSGLYVWLTRVFRHTRYSLRIYFFPCSVFA